MAPACRRAGTALLALCADRVGLTDGLIDALAPTRRRQSGHEPGRVASDLAVMLAGGGRCVSDLAALAGQPALFGEVASVSTARRVVLLIGEGELAAIRAARARARARAWRSGAAPERVILDFDATPIDVHSDKQDAAGHYKGGFGFHPLIVSCAREVLAGILRPGNAGANKLRLTEPSSRTPARSIARTSFRTWRSTIRSSIADINPSCGIASKEGTTHCPSRWLPGDGAGRAARSRVGGPLA